MTRFPEDHRYLIPFRSRLLPQIFCDTLVIGTGVGGLRAALSASPQGEVIVLSKSALAESSTALAQGGIAAVTSTDDSLDAHILDTLEAGAGLCDYPAVQHCVKGAERQIQLLRQWGMVFDSDDNTGQIRLGREGAHSTPRILHADGDATGRELVRCLGRQVKSQSSIRVFEECFAVDLLTDHDDAGETRVYGAITYHPHYGLQMIWATSTILATGGVGQVYRETTNSAVTTGDGLAMAFRAGAAIADMCFMQFHPTTLYVAGAPRSLVSEAVRGEGAFLVDSAGNRFMQSVHEMAELAPRDVVSLAISRHLEDTGDTHVFLDTRHFKRGYFASRFPTIYEQLQRFDLNPEKQLIPVKPSAHYTIGGVWIDKYARTNLPGLYACGEVASSGLHGANRLASNSLLEGLVVGDVAGQAVLRERESNNAAEATAPVRRSIVSDIPISDRSELDIADVRSSLQSAALRQLGTQRSQRGLQAFSDQISFWGRYTLDKIFDDPFGWETQNLLQCARLICQSAAWRNETRGTHTMVNRVGADDDMYRVHDVWTRDKAEPTLVPVQDANAANEASPVQPAGSTERIGES